MGSLPKLASRWPNEGTPGTVLALDFGPIGTQNVTHNIGKCRKYRLLRISAGSAGARAGEALDPGFQSSITSNLNQMPLKARMRALSWWGEQWGVHKRACSKRRLCVAFMEPPHGPILRQCFLDNKSLLPRRGRRKPNNGGLFAPDLMTGFAAPRAVWLSLRPFLSKADDCGI